MIHIVKKLYVNLINDEIFCRSYPEKYFRFDECTCIKWPTSGHPLAGLLKLLIILYMPIQLKQNICGYSSLKSIEF